MEKVQITITVESGFSFYRCVFANAHRLLFPMCLCDCNSVQRVEGKHTKLCTVHCPCVCMVCTVHCPCVCMVCTVHCLCVCMVCTVHCPCVCMVVICTATYQHMYVRTSKRFLGAANGAFFKSLLSFGVLLKPFSESTGEDVFVNGLSLQWPASNESRTCTQTYVHIQG